jgi:tetratricopeptide (TPR) repeat protein
MIAFLAVALHSAVDFSLQIPAVACLAAAAIAQLVALNRSDPNVPPSAAHPTVLTLRFSALGIVAVCLFALATSGVLILHAWKAEQTYRCQLGAFRSLKQVTPPDLDQAITFLQTATHIDPSDTDLQLGLGQLYLDRTPAKDRLAESIRPGIRHMILARNSCPLLARPQMRLAAYAKLLDRADPPERYWERAAQLAPSDADFWYLRGAYALKQNDPAEAWNYWRRSLQLSPVHLKEIVAAAYPKLGINGLLSQILPENAELIVKSAELLPPDSARETLKRLYSAAGNILDSRGDDLTAYEYYLKARCAEELGETDKALRAFKIAIDMTLTQNEWRLRYARLLHRANKLPEARREFRELLKVLGDRPDIKDELDTIEREIQISE